MRESSNLGELLLRRSAATLILAFSTAAQATVSFNVDFVDPGGTFVPYYAQIENSVKTAGTLWSQQLETAGSVQLDVRIGFDAGIPTANGASGSASLVRQQDGFNVVEMGAARKLLTGFDVNGSQPDVVFNIGTGGYLQNELWFQPAWQKSLVSVPQDRTDAQSVFLHEFAHAFGFNGFRDYQTGALPGSFMSVFDTYMQFGTDRLWYFTGPEAQKVFGGPVPLTLGNPYHYGNELLLPSQPLGGLMNGVAFVRGSRYEIGSLDLAMLRDVGVPTVSPVPEAGTLAMMLTGLCALTGLSVAGSSRRRDT